MLVLGLGFLLYFDIYLIGGLGLFYKMSMFVTF